MTDPWLWFWLAIAAVACAIAATVGRALGKSEGYAAGYRDAKTTYYHVGRRDGAKAAHRVLTAADAHPADAIWRDAQPLYTRN